MKRSKLLIPTLTCLSIAPAIVSLSSCQQDNTEQKILDAIFGPMDLTEDKPIDSFIDSFDALSSDEQKLDVIYGTLGILNNTLGSGDKTINIRQLYKDNEGGFKVNLQKCEIKKVDGTYYGTLLGYVSYVFAKEHIMTTTSGTDIKFEANDYIMVTIDIVNASLVVDNSDFSISWQPKLGTTIGFYKLKYDGGSEESLIPIGTTWTTKPLDVKNSHRWVPKQ